VSGKKRKVRTASAVPCYPRYFSGAPERVMIDNTHVVGLRGTGRDRVGTRC
jgi:hypothetical protein